MNWLILAIGAFLVYDSGRRIIHEHLYGVVDAVSRETTEGA